MTQRRVPRLKDCFARFHHGCQYDVVAATSASETVTALTKGDLQARALRLRPQAGRLRTL